MANIAISNLNQIEEAAADDVLAIDDISAAETKKIPFESLLGKNALINQDFSIWQENTIFTNPAHSVADGYSIYKIDGGGTAPSVNVKKNTTNMEAGYKQCCELEITNVGVSDAGRRWDLKQSIEDFTKYQGKDITVAIRIKASVAMTLPGRINVHDGVAGASTNITSLNTTWQTVSVNLGVNAAASGLNTNFYMVGKTGDISTTGSIYIEWMKLEVGSVATPLIPRKNGDELRLCQRYYQKSYAQGTFPGAATTNGSEITYFQNAVNLDHSIMHRVKFPVVMKATPTITLYDAAGNSGKVTMAAGNNITGTVARQNDAGFAGYGTNGAANVLRHLEFHYTAVSRP